jgi:hypothetical protein
VTRDPEPPDRGPSDAKLPDALRSGRELPDRGGPSDETRPDTLTSKDELPRARFDEKKPDALLSGRELPRSVYIEVPEHGLSDDELPHPAVLERIWRVLSRWAIPVMMTLAYILLVATSDTDAVGSAVMGAGLVLVLAMWFVFRALTETAGLARAIGVGDVARLLAIADRRLPRTRRPAARARLLVARALAHQLRGDPTAAIAALDAARLAPEPAHAAADASRAIPTSPQAPDIAPLAHVVCLAARIELGRSTADLRALPPSSPRSPALTWLAEGQLAFSDGDLDTADLRFARVIDDIRAGSATRAMAHLYAARIADTRSDPTAAARHRAAAAALAAPDAAWLRPEAARSSHRARSD